MYLLRKYAPDVPEETLLKLTHGTPPRQPFQQCSGVPVRLTARRLALCGLRRTTAFADLRRLVDDGQISYPYSTRELVNIVRHMQQYPQEGISRILQNVFDFDQYEREVKDLLIRTLQKHGIPVGLESDFKLELGVEVRADNADPAQRSVWGVDAR